MQRHSDVALRPDWKNQILREGLVYSPTETAPGQFMSYWREGAAYSFTMADIDAIDEAAQTIFAMCVDAGDYLVENRDVMSRMGIPTWAHDMVIRSWNDTIDGEEFGSVYGRFDFRFGGLNHPDPALRTPQLFEFNADTPTCLVESAWIQWQWLQDTAFGPDQWNLLWESLIAAWQRNLALIEKRLGYKPVIYFAYAADESSGEDQMNTLYLRDACNAAGYQTDMLFIEEIMLGDDGLFYTPDGKHHLDVVFKLYPWEWLISEKFGTALVADYGRTPTTAANRLVVRDTIWIQPPYTMLWSNKGLLAVLWQLFGDDPDKSKYLIPAWFDGEQPASLGDHVRKPLLGREGANVTIIQGGSDVETHPGDYGDEGYIIQDFAPLPAFSAADSDHEVHPMCGVWMIDGTPQGLAIRESTTLVTDNASQFVPHIVSDAPHRTAPVEPTGILPHSDWSSVWVNPPTATANSAHKEN
ncbi:MAG: glutathionylspermidine synthase family protein [Propionibacteriaceae bacterium]